MIVPSWTFLHVGQKNTCNGKNSSAANSACVGYLFASGCCPRLRNSTAAGSSHNRHSIVAVGGVGISGSCLPSLRINRPQCAGRLEVGGTGLEEVLSLAQINRLTDRGERIDGAVLCWQADALVGGRPLTAHHLHSKVVRIVLHRQASKSPSRLRARRSSRPASFFPAR